MTSTLPTSSNGNGVALGKLRSSSPSNGQFPIAEAKISEVIRERLRQRGVSFLANDNIADHLLPGELETLQVEVADRVRDLLHSLVIDTENDHNTAETAERVAKMYLQEVLSLIHI